MTIDNLTIGFIGAGNMARAIGEGLIEKGILQKSQVIVSAPSDRNLGEWKELGVKTTNSNGEVVTKADIIFFVMKPYQLDVVLQGMQKDLEGRRVASKLFVSVLAGITIDTLTTKLKLYGQGNARLIRGMPNMPMMVGAGCSVISCDSSATSEDEAHVKLIFSSLGLCELVPESLITPVGGLAGCGPAFAYMMIEALSDGAVKQGLPRHLATPMAAQTLLGAAKMVLETKKHPGELKDEVCSPGGTTICGVHAMEAGGVRAALMNAVEAAAKRSLEIGASNE